MSKLQIGINFGFELKKEIEENVDFYDVECKFLFYGNGTMLKVLFDFSYWHKTYIVTHYYIINMLNKMDYFDNMEQHLLKVVPERLLQDVKMIEENEQRKIKESFNWF